MTKPPLSKRGVVPFLREQDLVQSWKEDHIKFVEQAILEPYNRITGAKIQMTTQQKEASKLLNQIIAAKLKVGLGTAVEADIAIARKIGISIMAGKGVGKDAWLSWAIIWFVALFPHCKVPCVSVSADQLHKVLWSEIAKWLGTSAVKGWLTLQNDKLFFNDLEEGIVGKRWFAFPKTANPKATAREQAETLAGVHEEYVMVAVDEASGITSGVFEPFEATLTGLVNFFVCIFNPTRATGYAIDTQEKNRDDWMCLQWNAEDSELGNKLEQERLQERYGRDSNPYRIRVLGLPPKTDEQALIPWEWIEEAVDRVIEGNETLPLVSALDCGAGGDQSIIAARRGYQIYPLQRLTTPDSMVLTNWAGINIDETHPDTFFVDTIGIGWAVEGTLRDKKGSVVEAADVRRTADNEDKYFNKRAEIYDRLRESFERGLISIPDDQDLKDQLGVIKCEFKGSKMKIIDKARIKAVLGHSPDEVDAVALTFYRAVELHSKKTAYKDPYLRSPFDVSGGQGWLRA